MQTMAWPPIPVNGRIPWVKGAEASTILVLLTLSDLQANPFNGLISLGDVTFTVPVSSRARIENALKRLTRIISVQSVEDKSDGEGNTTYTIKFTDLETKEPGRADGKRPV